MNEITELGGLSYKELQALALQCKIPRNIRKHMLIKVLEAVQQGNEFEAKSILQEIRQNRKKRDKKSNKQLKTLSYLGPALNPGSECQRETYYNGKLAQVAASNEARRRLTPSGIITSGGRHQGKFATSKIYQHHYSSSVVDEAYSQQNNSIQHINRTSQSPTIVDLRKNPYRISESDGTIQMTERQSDLLTLDSQNYQNFGNNNVIGCESPRLLKKILQAPAGTNLKQLINYENSYNISSVNSNIFDDSDTLTAESESNFNDNHNENDNFNDWLGPNGNIVNRSNELQDCPQIDYYKYDSHHQRQSNIVENCQKWLVNSSSMLVAGNTNDYENYSYNNENCMQQLLERRNIGDSQYYYHNDNEHCNLNTNDNSNHYGYQYQQQHYHCDVNLVEESISANIYTNTNNNSNNNDENNILVVNSQSDSPEWPAQCSSDLIVPSVNPEIYQNLDFCQTVSNNDDNNGVIDPTGTAFDYNKFEVKATKSCNEQPLAHYTDGVTNAVQEPEQSEHSQLNGLSMIENNIFDDYWPQWNLSKAPRIQTSGINFKLENLLNLENISSKSTEIKSSDTTYVYCYTSPIATQRISPSDGAVPLQSERNQDYILPTNYVSCIDAETPLDSNLTSKVIRTTDNTKENTIDNEKFSSGDMWINDFSSIHAINLAEHCNSL